ncbi:hypothetical protein [Aeromonas bestiarum]|uniref:hypothetical protein n=1 Tax=Aeromonas bestiarum TaxID=105751 RepID=UPI0011AFC32E|nr:hypothetical protein [Aeromonas bestiarum]
MGHSLTILILTLALGLICNYGALPLFNTYIILGVGLTLIVEYAIRYFAFKAIQPKPEYSKFQLEKNYFWLVISPGYFFSRYFKKKIQYRDRSFNKRLQKNSKAIFLKSANNKNLVTSAVIFLIVSIVGLLKNEIECQSFEFITQTALFFVLTRTLSRSVEVIYAFTNDAIESENTNSSSLNKYDRVKLALNSYVENILNFSAVYYLLQKEYVNVQGAFFSSIGRSTISNLDLEHKDVLLSFVAYGQVITTLTLVVLSLAIYVGRKK